VVRIPWLAVPSARSRRFLTGSSQTLSLREVSLLADTLRALEGQLLRGADGTARRLRLLPAASEAEIKALEQCLPCPLPEEVRAALKVSKGLANGPTESWSLMDLGGFGLEELLPYAYAIAHDGFWELLGS
jgi:hypothetical protein